MKVTVTVTANRLGEMAARLPQRLTEIVSETMDEMETTIAVGMAEPKSGRGYRRGARWHQASAPGESPAVDYGVLAASIQQRLDDHGAQGATGLVYTNTEYAENLEFGTSRMAARPFMTPAAERARAGFEGKIKALEAQL